MSNRIQSIQCLAEIWINWGFAIRLFSLKLSGSGNVNSLDNQEDDGDAKEDCIEYGNSCYNNDYDVNKMKQ